jgi:hypothetical protein
MFTEGRLPMSRSHQKQIADATKRLYQVRINRAISAEDAKQ